MPTPRPMMNGMLSAGLALVLAFSPGDANASGRAASQSGLRAGAARIDITPDRPVALEGYLNPETRTSEGVHDRLYARAVVLASGSRRVVLVSADLGSWMFGPHIKRIIAERLGLDVDDILLCAVHTHSGPQLSLSAEYPHPNNKVYSDTLVERLVTVVDRATRAVRPARLAVGRSTSSVGTSRRLILPDGRVEMAPNPAGVSDPEVMALTVRREDGRLMAVLFSYGCHSRSLGSANRLVSGDVFGIAALHAEQKLGPHVVVAGFAGASADVDPARVVDGFATDARETSETVRMGRSLGDSVLAAVGVSRQSSGLPLRFSAGDVLLPNKQAGSARKVILVAGAIGDVGIVATECEVSARIGLAIKAASPFPNTFVATVCNAWGGYLPAREQYPEGGYEVNQSPFAAEAAERFVEAASNMLRRLR